MKSAAIIVVSILFGAALGVYFSHLPRVRAAGGPLVVNVRKVHEGINKGVLIGSTSLGFACTQQDCYIATTD